MNDFESRVAFITGGANGIGLGIARALAKAGAKLALVDLDEPALKAANAELSKITQVFTATLDVRDRNGFAEVRAAVEKALGPVSILVNNAGVAAGARLDKLTYEQWDWGVDINLHGVFNGIRTFVPGMIERKAGGYVVNTASGAGLVESGAGVLYHATKYAVVGISESMCAELAPHGIGVSVLCPGPVATGIVERTIAAQPKTGANLAPEEREVATKRMETAKRALARGKSPDRVGEMVVAAMRENRLHIHTDTVVKAMLEARHKRIMDAFRD